MPSGKLLRFIISYQGIEANPEKITAVTRMARPTCVNDAQKLTGCMTALGRFITKLGERDMSFFKLLKKEGDFELTDEALEAFKKIKAFLTSPPILTAPDQEEPLLLYIAATTHVVSTVIIVERPTERHVYPLQRQVYFVSKVLGPSKVQYPRVQKLLYALLLTARKLKNYF